MDESTNALDKETENAIFEEIKQIRNYKTIVVISHKVNSLKICDTVYKVSDKKLLKQKMR